MHYKKCSTAASYVSPSAMTDWWKVSLLVSVFGFVKEIRPSEPFVYEFLIDKRWRNLTEQQVNQEVYPPLIVLLGASGIVVFAMLLWTEGLLELQILEVFYGTFCATEVAYYTYIYAKVDTEYFQQVTSHTRAAILAGRAFSGILGQLLISLYLMNYRELNYITFGAMIFATAWAVLLPPVKKSIYFHREETEKRPLRAKFGAAFHLMAGHFVNSFSNGCVLKWSLWFALSTCGFIQVQTYMQPLWAAIVDDSDRAIFNGAVEAVLTVIGFLGALLAGVLRVDWKTKGELLLTVCSLLQGFLMLFSSRTEYIVLCYVCYVAFGALYHFMITIVSSEVAKYIKEESYGLVLGSTRSAQYFVYGCFHVAIAVVYIVIGLATWTMSKRDYRRASIVTER
ncbi:hypothetical protein NQ318_019826 [Aromia moschata]|uniref:Uncharacterized protein n=1 Tax=Aromia moschata TaxID=1265417 RepID=A0AAV8YKK6_9CUCU|nr:hypothetical protein NQ318_019826 [Aromia moschata]